MSKKKEVQEIFIYLAAFGAAIGGIVALSRAITPDPNSQSSIPSVTPSSATTNPSSSPTITKDPSRQCSESSFIRKGSNLFGVIEVGSKGVKGEVIQELEKPNDEGFKLISREEEIQERNTSPVKPSAQTETVKGVDDVYHEIQERFGIPCEHIVIFGSSGLAQKAPHKDELSQEIQEVTGREMSFITPEEEASFVFDGVVPSWRRDQVVLIDIGSGNTKGAYLSDANSTKYTTFAIPYGTATFTDEVNQQRNNNSFTQAATKAKDSILIPRIRDIVQRKPGLQNSSRVYLAGGIGWALQTLTHPCSREQSIRKKEERDSKFGILSAEDINTFYINVTRNSKSLFNPDLSACKPDRKKQVMKDIAKLRTTVFSSDNLIAGSEILRALSKELSFSSKDGIFFSRYAIHALPLGYLFRQLENVNHDGDK